MSPLFLDFEASSLDEDSWPIEIGLAVRSSLIRPVGSWPASAWSEESAAVHRIPRVDLDAGPPAWLVARDYCAMMRDRVVLSDAPEYDGMWLQRLVDLAIGVRAIDLRSFDAEAHRRFGRAAHALDWVYEARERLNAPHRAGPDAARLAKAWREGLRRIGY
jgi:hypothetical protein